MVHRGGGGGGKRRSMRRRRRRERGRQDVGPRARKQLLRQTRCVRLQNTYKRGAGVGAISGAHVFHNGAEKGFHGGVKICGGSAGGARLF